MALFVSGLGSIAPEHERGLKNAAGDFERILSNFNRQVLRPGTCAVLVTPLLSMATHIGRARAEAWGVVGQGDWANFTLTPQGKRLRELEEKFRDAAQAFRKKCVE